MSKHLSRLILFISFVFVFEALATGQNLTPKELKQIHNNPDFAAITRNLLEKGFKQYSTGQTESRWYFQPFTYSGEEVSSCVIKSIDSNKQAKTVFFLYNPFNYKEFISNLKKSKYRLKGIEVIEDKSYVVFENKQTVFMTREHSSGRNKNYFEIIVHSK
ncbi:hypothetical protein [Pinibacter aurantiacus]|uniref:Uncharacterized protein n=1 Tax=Pinibacter aurantiacus TaxID=2851599 RepID=A0A9E2SBV2_9BACT|nr:hypothetical protein [Pinibacter aurantiacus]MBV4359696.1 hypothetical protein [Pinibacter aurantiacus]